jgi:hypothetical protein
MYLLQNLISFVSIKQKLIKQLSKKIKLSYQAIMGTGISVNVQLDTLELLFLQNIFPYL